MVDASQIKIGMPLDEFMRLYDTEGPFELINGERKRKMPQVAGHSDAGHIVYLALHMHTSPNQLGSVFMETTFILPDTYNPNWVEGSRIPDVMFFEPQRLAEYKAKTPDYKGRPYAIVPDLVVEVVSPNDQYSEIDAKVDLYLADGVRMVWVIDPQRRKVSVHTPDREDPHVLKGDAVLKGDDVVPGFEISLTKLFES